MGLWHSDHELFTLAKREMFTAVVGDVLDRLGYQHQFLPPRIKPLRPDMIVIGRAMPVLEADIQPDAPENGADGPAAQPFGLMFRALDDLQPDEVYVCSGASPTYALWGGLMSTRALRLGAAGAVLHGYSRDTNEILRLNFPTFSYGGYAQDQGPRGRVIDFRSPIMIEQVRIQPGDVVYGDLDGVCVVPREVEEEAFSAALEKVRGEQMVRKAIEDGMSSAEAFEKFGIM
jgi:regulator of RNase E activity RraA